MRKTIFNCTKAEQSQLHGMVNASVLHFKLLILFTCMLLYVASLILFFCIQFCRNCFLCCLIIIPYQLPIAMLFNLKYLQHKCLYNEINIKYLCTYKFKAIFFWLVFLVVVFGLLLIGFIFFVQVFFKLHLLQTVFVHFFFSPKMYLYIRDMFKALKFAIFLYFAVAFCIYVTTIHYYHLKFVIVVVW